MRESRKSSLKTGCRCPKASRNDIMRTIADDAELHDDVLLMNSVGISRL